MDNFLLESIQEHISTDIYFSNGWRYGVPIPPGDIKLEDLYNIVPMDPVVSTVELSGAEISEIIENNLEHTYSNNPLSQMGGYVKRALGIKVFFKLENPKNTRIAGFREYYIAAFITEQGVPANYGSGRSNTDLHAVEAMMKRQIADTGLSGTFIPV